MDELVGLAAVQQSSDGWKGVQNDGLRVGINIVLKHRDTNILITFLFPFFFFLTLFMFTLLKKKKKIKEEKLNETKFFPCPIRS